MAPTDTEDSELTNRFSKYAVLVNALLENEWTLENSGNDDIPVGIEGRIFEEIVRRILDNTCMPYEQEKRHIPKLIKPYFLEMSLGAGRTLRERRRYYLPDFTLLDNHWLETTLWESEAHKKSFLYAHQCDQLTILYLCPSSKIYNKCPFPNTNIVNIYNYFSFNQIGSLHSHLLHLQNFIKNPRACSKRPMPGG